MRLRLIVLGMLLVPFLSTSCRTVQVAHPSRSDQYLISPGDVLHVEVFREPDISGRFEVNSNGSIHHPLLGSVSVLKLSVPDAKALLTGRLAEDYLVDPNLTVSLTRSTGRPIMIFGEVRKPGAYDVESGRRETLLQIIARAGGFTDIAARDRVRIVRSLDGKEQSIRVRVTDLLRGRDGVTDIDLMPGDVITVPETFF
jgi:protein involved in polysaccharide export with SLBB domain